jgi:hypothetical protein
MDASTASSIATHPVRNVLDATGHAQAKIHAETQQPLDTAIISLGQEKSPEMLQGVLQTLRTFSKDIAVSTVKLPRGKKEVGKLMDDMFTSKDRNGKTLTGKELEKQHQEARFLAFEVSARDLAKVHTDVATMPGARHLHPYQPGLSTTRPYDDERKVVIIWKYPPPRHDQINAEPLVLTDGSLAAAFLREEVPKEKWGPFLNHQSKVYDYLCGNKHALIPNNLKRAYRNSLYRFKVYFRGMNEGMSAPRFNGSIGANLVLTSLPISALLYCLIYAIDYTVTNRNLQKHKLDHYAQAQQAKAQKQMELRRILISYAQKQNQLQNQAGSPPPTYAMATGGWTDANAALPSYASGQAFGVQPAGITV